MTDGRRLLGVLAIAFIATGCKAALDENGEAIPNVTRPLAWDLIGMYFLSMIVAYFVIGLLGRITDFIDGEPDTDSRWFLGLGALIWPLTITAVVLFVLMKFISFLVERVYMVMEYIGEALEKTDPPDAGP